MRSEQEIKEKLEQMKIQLHESEKTDDVLTKNVILNDCFGKIIALEWVLGKVEEL